MDPCDAEGFTHFNIDEEEVVAWSFPCIDINADVRMLDNAASPGTARGGDMDPTTEVNADADTEPAPG